MQAANKYMYVCSAKRQRADVFMPKADVAFSPRVDPEVAPSQF